MAATAPPDAPVVDSRPRRLAPVAPAPAGVARPGAACAGAATAPGGGAFLVQYGIVAQSLSAGPDDVPARLELRRAVAGAFARAGAAGAAWRSSIDRARAAASRDWGGDAEICGCSGRMRYGSCGAEAVCESCGRVDAGDDAAADDAPRPPTGPLRIVGRGARLLQPDMYSSAPGAGGEGQFGSVLDELRALNAAHVAAGGLDFAEDALVAAAAVFGAVEREVTRRNDARKRLLAACLRRGCLAVQWAPPDDEIARFAQLTGRGIARGDNSLRALAADGKLPEFRDDPAAAGAAEIATFFAKLGLGGAAAAPLRAAAAAVVAQATRHSIGCESLLRAKHEGAAFEVIRRAPAAMLAERPGAPLPTDLRGFCAAAGVRLNTLERFVAALAAHHSRFSRAYRKFGLTDTPV